MAEPAEAPAEVAAEKTPADVFAAKFLDALDKGDMEAWVALHVKARRDGRAQKTMEAWRTGAAPVMAQLRAAKPRVETMGSRTKVIFGQVTSGGRKSVFAVTVTAEDGELLIDEH